MDVDTAWQKFKEANIKKADNQTSVDDKLDVILAQQRELLADTSRVADLVPMVTGDKAEEDALEESGDLEAEQNPEGTVQEEPAEGMGEEPASEEGVGEDNPFAFLDEEENPEEEPAEGETEEYEETDEDSDIFEASQEGMENAEEPEEESDEDTADETEENTDEETDEDVPEEDETEEESDEDESEDDSGIISFDEIEDDEEPEETKKSEKMEIQLPRTKTIKSFGTPQPMTVIKTVQKPTSALSYGRASSAEQVADMLMKANSSDEFEIGYGVDPHKAVEKDWAEYRLMKKLNANLF